MLVLFLLLLLGLPPTNPRQEREQDDVFANSRHGKFSTYPFPLPWLREEKINDFPLTDRGRGKA